MPEALVILTDQHGLYLATSVESDCWEETLAHAMAAGAALDAPSDRTEYDGVHYLAAQPIVHSGDGINDIGVDDIDVDVDVDVVLDGGGSNRRRGGNHLDCVGEASSRHHHHHLRDRYYHHVTNIGWCGHAAVALVHNNNNNNSEKKQNGTKKTEEEKEHVIITVLTLAATTTTTTTTTTEPSLSSLPCSSSHSEPASSTPSSPSRLHLRVIASQTVAFPSVSVHGARETEKKREHELEPVGHHHHHHHHHHYHYHYHQAPLVLPRTRATGYIVLADGSAWCLEPSTSTAAPGVTYVCRRVVGQSFPEQVVSARPVLAPKEEENGQQQQQQHHHPGDDDGDVKEKQVEEEEEEEEEEEDPWEGVMPHRAGADGEMRGGRGGNNPNPNYTRTRELHEVTKSRTLTRNPYLYELEIYPDDDHPMPPVTHTHTPSPRHPVTPSPRRPHPNRSRRSREG